MGPQPPVDPAYRVRQSLRHGRRAEDRENWWRAKVVVPILVAALGMLSAVLAFLSAMINFWAGGR